MPKNQSPKKTGSHETDKPDGMTRAKKNPDVDDPKDRENKPDPKNKSGIGPPRAEKILRRHGATDDDIKKVRKALGG